jgi:hypothetical protein
MEMLSHYLPLTILLKLLNKDRANVLLELWDWSCLIKSETLHLFWETPLSTNIILILICKITRSDLLKLFNPHLLLPNLKELKDKSIFLNEYFSNEIKTLQKTIIKKKKNPSIKINFSFLEFNKKNTISQKTKVRK